MQMICFGVIVKAQHCLVSTLIPRQLSVQLKSWLKLTITVFVSKENWLLINLENTRVLFLQASVCSTHPVGRDCLLNFLPRCLKLLTGAFGQEEIGVQKR